MQSSSWGVIKARELFQQALKGALQCQKNDEGLLSDTGHHETTWIFNFHAITYII